MDFDLEFALKIARILSELEEKDEIFFSGTDATLDLRALGEKQEFCVEVVPNGKRELLDFKTDSAKYFWVKVEKLELLESFEDRIELNELTAEKFRRKRWKICVTK